MTKFANAIHYLRLYGEVHQQNEHAARAAGIKPNEAEHKLAQDEIVEAIVLLQEHDEPRKPS